MFAYVYVKSIKNMFKLYILYIILNLINHTWTYSWNPYLQNDTIIITEYLPFNCDQISSWMMGFNIQNIFTNGHFF